MDWRDQTDENESAMGAMSLGVHKIFTTLAPLVRTVPGMCQALNTYVLNG